MQTVIEIIPTINKFHNNTFINIQKEEHKKYSHIYFNDNKKEIYTNCITPYDNVN